MYVRIGEEVQEMLWARMSGGCIELDTDLAQSIGFTSDLFSGWLWLSGDSIYISTIESKHPGRGNFSKLIKAIHAMKLTVKIPTALGLMEKIAEKKGFTKQTEHTSEMGPVEVWVLGPKE